jgi:hypothetical protein
MMAVDETADGEGRVVGAKETDGKGTLGWTAGGMAEGALPGASDELSTLTYHSSKMLYPLAYWEILSFDLTI